MSLWKKLPDARAHCACRIRLYLSMHSGEGRKKGTRGKIDTLRERRTVIGVGEGRKENINYITHGSFLNINLDYFFY